MCLHVVLGTTVLLGCRCDSRSLLFVLKVGFVLEVILLLFPAYQAFIRMKQVKGSAKLVLKGVTVLSISRWLFRGMLPSHVRLDTIASPVNIFRRHVLSAPMRQGRG